MSETKKAIEELSSQLIHLDDMLEQGHPAAGALADMLDDIYEDFSTIANHLEREIALEAIREVEPKEMLYFLDKGQPVLPQWLIDRRKHLNS